MKLYKLLILPALILSLTACGSKNKPTGESGNIDRDEEKVEVFVKEENPSTSFKNGIPTLLDFSATWCGPCRQIAPYVEEQMHKYSGKINFKPIDIDQQGELAEQYGVEAVPTFIMLDSDGKEIGRVVGADRDGLDAMISAAVKLE